MSQLTYAKALGPPDDWENLKIVHADGTEDRDVIEANSEEGWLIRYRRDADGKLIVSGDECLTERIECSFTIERRT